MVEQISFWGGVASIVALLITLGGGAYFLYSKLKNWNSIELAQLESAQKQIQNRTRAATTQGKRMDLFMYHQSLFSSLRFRLLTLEVATASAHIMSLMIFFVFVTLDRNAQYAIDELFPFANWRNNYGLHLAVFTLFMTATNAYARNLLMRQRRRLNVLSSSFIRELQDVVEEKIPTNPSGSGG